MSNVIPEPHGGKLINRIISEIEKDILIGHLTDSKTYNISDADLSIFYRIADGALSPLEGPMSQEEINQVLEHEYIERDGNKLAWTIPIAFPISKEDADKFKVGDTVAVNNAAGELVGSLEISDIYKFDKAAYNKSVYLTERADHPGPRIFNDDPRDYLLGGKIWALPQPKDPVFGKYMLSPEETRSLFAERGWERIVAFQTRNALHRAHEYAMVYAAEKLTREGYFTGVVLNALVGATKADDVPADVRMSTYEALLKAKMLGYGDLDEELWKEKGYNFYEQLLLIGLDMKMFYAGPKEAIMHSIYRQNYGFTNIIIGRNHADAPFDDGTPAWGDFDAHEKFDQLNGSLQIEPVKVGFAAFFEEINRVGLISEFKPKGYHIVAISGKDLRKKLQNGEPVDERIMRKPIADILTKFYHDKLVKERNITWHETSISKEDREKRNGHKGVVIWLTGLSGSGKSTVGTKLQAMLFEEGCNVYILDGDNVRHGLNKDLGFSPEDREENIRRIGEVAALFADSGAITLTSFISPYKKDRDLARAMVNEGEFIEIFVKASVEVCTQRDPKGLYKKALAGEIKEFTGISAPYEEPDKPELVIETDKLSVDKAAQAIFDYLKNKKIIG